MKRNLTNWKEKLWEKGRIQRYLSLLLVAVLVVTQCTQSMGSPLVIAQTGCQNHETHDESCTYAEETRVVQECNHAELCDETCISRVLECQHVHDESCSTQELLNEEACTHSHEDGACNYNEETQECDHVHDADCGAVTVEELEVTEGSECVNHQHTEECYVCMHEHDENCGYLEETVVVTECNHTCELCENAGSEDSDVEEELSEKEKIEESEEEEITDTCEHGETREMCLVCNPVENQLEEITEEISLDYALENVSTGDGVPINASTFPDNVFRQYISEKFDKDKDGVLSDTEIWDATVVDLNGSEDAPHGCTSFKGIEYLTNLQYLYFKHGKMKSLTLNNEKLVEIQAHNNELESVDISGCTSLIRLYIYNNYKIETLDISNNKALTNLGMGCAGVKNIIFSEDNRKKISFIDGYANNFKTLDLSGFTELTFADLANNTKMTSLDVSGCTKLAALGCNNNPLTILNASNTALEKIDLATVTQLEKLDLSNSAVSGNLTFATQTKLEDLNTSNCTSIKSITVTAGALKYLDASGCTSLQGVDLVGNPLVKMDLSTTGIGTISVSATTIEELDVSGCQVLETVTCIDRPLKKLDASDCPLLNTVTCYNNQLESLDVTNCPTLKSLYCYDNQLTSLELTGCSILDRIDGQRNPWINLDLSGATQLTLLNCGNGELTSLNLSANTILKKIWCSNNNLKELDLTENDSLTHLYCVGNEIQTLDVSHCVDLEALECGNNGLVSLNLGEKPKLKQLSCNGNALTELDVSSYDALEYLNCYNNQITELNIHVDAPLGTLSCGTNQLTSLDVSKNEELTTLKCTGNQLTELNITGLNFDGGTFDASKQMLGTLPLYQSNGNWVNNPASAARYITFDKTNTSFYRDEALQTSLTDEGFEVVEAENVSDGKGVVSAITAIPMVSPVYFKTVLNAEKGYNLSGNFTYSLEYGTETEDTTALSASTAYIDVKDAMALKDVNELADYFEFSGKYAPKEGDEVTVSCTVFDTKLTQGLIRPYEVTLTCGEYSCKGTIEVCVEIEHTNGVDEEGNDIFDHFPDPNFRDFVKRFDTVVEGTEEGDGFLTKEELDAVTVIDLCGLAYDSALKQDQVIYHNCKDVECATLEGVEYFSNLERLLCGYVGLTGKLDVSNNTELEDLQCSGNTNLTELDISGCTKLTILGCAYCGLEELEVRQCKAMYTLYCRNNSLKEMDLSNCKQLHGLSIQENKLTLLNVKGLSNLYSIECQLNQLTSLDLSGLENLYALRTYYMESLTSINVNSCTSLNLFYTYGSNLTSLDLSDCSELTRFDCTNNKITNLKINEEATFTTFNTHSQNLGNLSMYQMTDGTWSNMEKNSKDIVADFMPGEGITTLHQPSVDSGGIVRPATQLDTAKYNLNDEGHLIISEGADKLDKIAFKTVVGDGRELTGYFTYDLSDLVVADGYIDVNDVKALTGPEDLLDYLDITINTRTTYTIDCPDYLKIKEGTLGQYEVTVTYNGTTSKKSVLEVGVEIDAQDAEGNYLNFPDRAFRSFIKDYIDIDEDGFLTAKELDTVAIIDLCGAALRNEFAGNQNDLLEHSCNIECASLEGISYFKNLKELYCGGANLTGELDLTAHTDLETLVCGSNNLTEIDVSGLASLKRLWCKNNGTIHTLNFSGCTAITSLACQGNSLTSLDISGLTQLENLECQENLLTSIDASGLASLKNLRCYYMPTLTSLDVSGCVSLELLYNYCCSLKTLDLSDCVNLSAFSCLYNQISILKINENAPFNVLFQAAGQSLGELSMYPTGAESMYVNKAENVNDNAVVFATGTNFKKENVNGDLLNGQNTFCLDNQGRLTLNSEIYSETVYFEKEVADGKSLSGTFTYETTTLRVSDGRIDVNEAKALRGKEDLLDYISAKDLVIESGATYEIICSDYDDINDGIPGDYTVTIKSGEVTKNTVIQVGVRIDYQEDGVYKNFPDEDFRGYVVENVEGSDDGFLTLEEMKAVTEIIISGSSGTGNEHPYDDLTGIEYFSNLRTLECSYGLITNLNLEKNLMLQKLECAYNQLERLDLSKNEMLEEVQISYNRFSNLDTLIFGTQKYLYDLRMGGNNFTDLNLSGFPALDTLYCRAKNIRISDCSSLREFYTTGYAELESLEIEKNTKLEKVHCYSSGIRSLDFSGFPALKEVRCQANPRLTSVNVSKCPKLEILHSYSNAILSELNVSGCPSLKTLYCHNCRLANIDASDSPISDYAGSGQNLGTLSMYADGEFIINKKKNNDDIVAAFVSETTFKSGSITLNEENVFYLNEEGALTVNPTEIQNPGAITFTTPELPVSEYATKTIRLTGSFTYQECDVPTTGKYIERNDAKALGTGDINKLINCIQYSEDVTVPATAQVSCTDFDEKIREGVPGRYDVTVSWTENGAPVTKTGTVDVVVQIDLEENFEDPLFQSYIAEKIDIGVLAGYLTVDELNAVTVIDIRGTDFNNRGNVESLEGIGFFTNLEKIYCQYNKIGALNLENNPKIWYLDIGGNYITNIDLKCVPELRWLSAPANGATDIDISNNFKLEVLHIGSDNNFGRSFDLSEYKNLQKFWCYNANVTGIILGENTALTEIRCYTNPIASLNVAGCTALEYLDCGDTGVTALELGNSPNLQTLRCYSTEITELDASNHKLLKTVRIDGSKVQSLDVSGCSVLATLNCARANSLETLNASGCTSLTTLDCSSLSKLESLDVSSCTALTTLNCYENASMTTLSIDNCTSLTTLNCYSSNLSSLDVSDCISLTTLACYYNKTMKQLDVSGCTSLLILQCYGNDLDSLNLHNNKSLDHLDCGENNLTELDLSNNSNLKNLLASTNNLIELDLSNNPRLSYLNVTNNELNKLNVSRNTSLQTIYCNMNRLTGLDVSECPLTTFVGDSQLLGTLPVYADTDDGYLINEAKNSSDRTAEFLTGTTFTQEGNALTTDNGFGLNGDGRLRFKNTSAKAGKTISFSKTLAKNANADPALNTTLTGTFTYSVYDVIISDGTIERTAAMSLGENAQNDLLSSIPMEGTAANAKISACADFASIRAGIPGYYDATVTYTDSASNTVSRDTTIELVVDISKTGNFADTDFQNYVKAYDIDGGNILDVEELGYVKEMYLNGSSKAAHIYDDLTGIELFMNLELLDCGYGPTGTPMTALDLSANTKLKTLDCSNNAGLTTLTLGANTNLETVDCSSINLAANGLNVAGCSNLKILKCTDSKLTSLDVTANKNLKTLYCSYNDLISLNVDDYLALEELSCDGNDLKALNVSKLINLESLSCNGNALTSLDVEGLQSLTSVQASEQVIEELDMTYTDDRWIHTAEEGEMLRTFQPDNLTDFYYYKNGQPTTKTNYFEVNEAGVLTAGTLLPKIDTVYFVSDLQSGNGKLHSAALNGTFAYDLTYQLSSVNRQMYTSDEIAAYGFKEAAELNQLGSLLTVDPNAEEVKAQVVMSMTEGFDAFASGTEGEYTYTAQLGTSNFNGTIDVLPEGAAINAERTAYLYAGNIILGTSTLRSFAQNASALLAKIIEKAVPEYGTYGPSGIQRDRTASLFTVKEEDLSALQAVTEESRHFVTIGLKDNEELAVQIRVRVIDDDPSGLVKIPANIILSREINGNYATGEGQIGLYSDFTDLVTDTVEVRTAKTIQMISEESTVDSFLVDIYTFNDANEETAYNGTDPLVTLDTDNLQKAFKLKSRSVRSLKNEHYTGTMQFEITYSNLTN